MAEAGNVFLSYSRNEAPFVRSVADRLKQRGFGVWFDREGRISSAWQDDLRESLDSADIVIVFISTTALESPWINFEIGAAVGREKHLVPVFLTEAARASAPPLLKDRAGIDASRLKPEEVAEQIANAAAAA